MPPAAPARLVIPPASGADAYVDLVLERGLLRRERTGRSDCAMFPIPQRTALCPADVETARRWYALPLGVATASVREQPDGR